MTVIVRKCTNKSWFSIDKCFKLLIMTCNFIIQKKERVTIFCFRCKYFAFMLFVYIIFKNLKVFLTQKRTKMLSTYLLYVIGLKWFVKLWNPSFYGGIKIHYPKENTLPFC